MSMKLLTRPYLIAVFINEVVDYPAASAQTSDSSVDDFKMIVYEKIFGRALDKIL